MNDKPAKIEMVTLKQLCTELKVDPRESTRRASLSRARRKEEPGISQVAQARARVGMTEAPCTRQARSRCVRHWRIDDS
jgi:hypothetical protein